VDLTGDFVTKLYSVINGEENKLQINIGTSLYNFNFDINNWDGAVKGLSYDKTFNIPFLDGFTYRNKVAHAFHNTTQAGLIVSQEYPDRVSALATMPYIIFSVTPEVGKDVDFVDMFLCMSYAPYSVQVDLNPLFTDSSTVYNASISSYKGGLYHVHGFPRRSVSGGRLVGRTLFVKVTFPDSLNMYDLKMVKTGYNYINE
jgi:hypothetical protein